MSACSVECIRDKEVNEVDRQQRRLPSGLITRRDKEIVACFIY